MYRLIFIYNNLLVHLYFEPLVVVAILAVVVDDVQVLAGAHLVQVVNGCVD